MFKQLQVSKIKAGSDDDLEEGTFQAYASVFDNIDSYGDVVRKGAFEESLAEWFDPESMRSLPLLWGHDTYDPFSNIGSVIQAREDEHGLWVEGQLDLENAKAMQVYRMLKGRRIDQMSFAFDTITSQRAKVDGQDVNELLKLKLYEVSVVPYGANAETEVLLVKQASNSLIGGVKAGRVLSAKNESELRAAYDSIGRVLDALEKNDEEPKASSQDATLKGDEPAPPAKSDEATQPGSVAARINLDLAFAEFELL